MSSKNIVSMIIIAAVLVGGGIALYKLDTGQGTRTDRTVSARSASD